MLILKLGDKVLCNGYEGFIVDMCEWTTDMIEVRLDSGRVVVETDEVELI